MKPVVDVFPDNQYAALAAERIGQAMISSIHDRGSCRLGLAGGSTPGPVYESLASMPWSQKIDWNRVQLLWGDERCVPPDHPQSNYRMVQKSLIRQVAIPAQNIHRVRGEHPPSIAAQEYEQVVALAAIDVLLLGMGSDGHTASLFPQTPELGESERRVIAATSPFEPRHRVSLTFRAINESRLVCLLVTGADKASRLAEVLQQIKHSRCELPAAMVQPASGQLCWLLDQHAAAEL
jgi:6-phosphogluconolactonase